MKHNPDCFISITEKEILEGRLADITKFTNFNGCHSAFQIRKLLREEKERKFPSNRRQTIIPLDEDIIVID